MAALIKIDANKLPPNIREALEKLAMLGNIMDLAEDPEDGSDGSITFDTQMKRLTKARGNYDVVHTFNPGDFVQYKEGVGLHAKAQRERLIMYWRPLDDENYQDKVLVTQFLQKASMERVDCMTAHLCADGHCLIHLPCDSRALEPYTP